MGVESLPGKGAIFWFTAYLKLDKSSIPAMLPAANILLGRRIWVVVQNQIMGDLLCRELRAWGVQCESYAQLEELLDCLPRKPEPDLVVAEPSFDEVEAQHLLTAMQAADQRSPPARVVWLIPHGKSGAWKSPIGPGGQPILTKPIRRRQLYECLTRTLEGVWPDLSKAGQPQVRGEPSGNLSQASVLVAEDNRVNQTVVRAMLLALGCHVDVVSNGREALAALNDRRYDLVLMDCQMPEMDGLEATTELRRREAVSGNGYRVPVVAVTANALKGDRERCLLAGMDDYVSKPFKKERLQEVLALWSRKRSAEVAPLP